MSTNTKEVRRFALFISVITAISLALTGCSAPSAQVVDLQPKTSQFVVDSFDNGEFLTPFEPGKPEIGLTLEALINLSLLGKSTEELQESIDWATSNTALLTSTGLKAAYVFAAYSAGFSDHPTVPSVLFDVKDKIGADGTVEETNNFAYSWVIFALLASENNELANQVAVKLVNNSEISGGYKYTKGDTQSFESADVTSFAVMSITATEELGAAEDETAKEFGIGRSSTWLTNNLTDETFFEAYENFDLAGTSYGIMALNLVGKDASKSIEWLAARINAADGGIPSPYSADASDVFTSVQALLPLSSLSFNDALNKINLERSN